MIAQEPRPAADPDVRLVPADQTFVISGLDALASLLLSGAWRASPASAFVLRRKEPGIDFYYLFTRSVFAQLAIAARQQLLRAFDLDGLRQVFNLHEYTAALTVAPGALPCQPALVMDGAILQGAWIPAAEREPELGVPRAEGEKGLEGFIKSYRQPTERPRVSRGVAAAPAAAEENATAPLPDEPFQRVPHMDLSKEIVSVMGELLKASVYVDTTAARPGESAINIMINAPATIKEFPVTVRLADTDHFALRSPQTQTLLLRRDQARSPVVEFLLELIASRSQPEVVNLQASFFYQGRPCGGVTHAVTVAVPQPAIAAPASAAPPKRTKTEARSSMPTEAMAIDPLVRPADLVLTITDPDNDQRTFECCVQSPLLEEYRDGVWMPWNLPDVTSQIVHAYFDQFVRNVEKSQRRNALRGAGLQLYKSTPPHFKDALWKILDRGLPLRSILIVSAEPFIPWELMVPWRNGPGGRQERQPLGVEFAIGRWVREDNLAPAQSIPLTDSYVLAPDYRGPKPAKLASAKAEAQFVLDNFNGRLISPAVFALVEATMAAGGASLFHVVCHGAESSPVAQQVYLEDGNALSSVDVEGSASMAAACQQRKPLVFLNACEVGRTQPALIGIGGFAQTFINLGAKGVVAPLWSVDDQIAHEVAVEFYQTILAEPRTAFAEILRRIRSKAYLGVTGGEDTYAAYCFYGDPLAVSARQ